MSKSKIIFLLVITFFIVACTPQTPEEQLHKTISELIEALDQENSRELFANYIDPSIFIKSPSANNIHEEKLKKLRLILRKTKEISPVMSDDGNFASFNFPNVERPLNFIKIEGRWFITE